MAGRAMGAEELKKLAQLQADARSLKAISMRVRKGVSAQLSDTEDWDREDVDEFDEACESIGRTIASVVTDMRDCACVLGVSEYGCDCGGSPYR